MCGRFANAQTIPQYRSAVRAQLPDPERHQPTPAPDADDYRPSHNVAPQTRSPVVRRELSHEKAARLQTSGGNDQEQIIIQTMKWGLIPRFHKTPPSYGEAYKTINARDDTILSPQRSLWHPLLPSQRCVVFVQGFYEWQKRSLGGPVDSEKIERIPHFVGMKEDGPGREDKDGHSKRLMPLAGLYERVRFDGEKEPLYTFTIVTTSSNDQLEFLHDRMPVILPTADAIGTWLGLGHPGTKDNPDDTWNAEVAKLLRPTTSQLDCYKVPREVGKVGNSDPSFILPIEDRKDGLRAFFAKHPPTDPGNSDKKRKERDNEAEDDVELADSLDEKAAVKVVREVEEDADLVEATARAEREHEDRELALRLHQEMNGDNQEISAASKESAKDEVEGHDIGDGFAVPDQHPNESCSSPHGVHEATETAQPHLPPSSRFSPDPYNPPLSPHRPKGGYSRALPASSGGGIHINPARGGRNSHSKPSRPFPQAPPHTWKNTAPPPDTSTKPINQIFTHTQQSLSTAAAQRAESPPPPPKAQPTDHKSPKRARVKSNDHPASSPSRHAPDIRSFFSPKKS